MAKPTTLALRDLARRDPRLGAALRKLPAFPGFPDAAHRRFKSHWDALARAIVFQQLATKAASTIHGRVCALTPGEHFPESAEFLRLDDARLRGAGLSGNKVLALRDLAARLEDGRLDVDSLERVDDDAIVERLVAVRGIGEWSAQMFLLFRLGRLDVGASGDLGVREGLRLLDGDSERLPPKAALARMEIWRPLRSVGCWMMWRLVEAERARTAERRAAKPASNTPRSSNPARKATPAKATSVKMRPVKPTAVKPPPAKPTAQKRTPRTRAR